MKKNYTHIVFLIDRSGSMGSIKVDMEGGLKEFLEKQKLLPGECTVTAAQFDTVYEILHKLKPLSEIEGLHIDPRGGTALIDSMVRLIKEVGDELRELPEDQRPEKVLFITITDGEENSSKEFTNEQLKERILEQETKYNWQFTYLGANQDAFGVSRQFGLSSAKAMNFAADSDGIKSVFNKLSDASTRYRSAAVNTSFEYTKEEQENP